MEKTYTVTVTYEAQITTNYTKDDIENALWVGDLEIGLIHRYNGNISIRGDAVDYDIQEE
jgi:ethanolamine utilization microcompartment shell protein EutS